MSDKIEIATLRQMEGKMNKIPFYLLVVVNILMMITFFVIMMLMLNANIEYTKDVVVTTEYIYQSIK